MAAGAACVECAAVEPDAQPTDEAARPARYGPFYRLLSPTQTEADAELQGESGEIWGRRPFGSGWPKVQAYRGGLPEGRSGIEFYTDAVPDLNTPDRHVSWSREGGAIGVLVEGDFAKIRCVVTKISRQDGSK
jgi:hypothetical protein